MQIRPPSSAILKKLIAKSTSRSSPLPSPPSAHKIITSMASSHPIENVQDYPRPPLLEKTPLHLQVKLDGVVVADTTNAYRVCETHHPPTYYIPPEDCTPGIVVPSPGGTTFCEWKGKASYYDVILPATNTTTTKSITRRVWAYPFPTPPFKPIAGYYSFYAHPFECYVDGERVHAQPGDFYGGWQTSWITGAIKGSPGTLHW